MFTLNSTEVHAVCYALDQQGGKGGANYSKDICPTILSDSHGTPHAVCYRKSYGLEPGAAKRMNWENRICEEVSPTLRENMGDNQVSVIILEHHPNDSRIKIAQDGICQALTSRMGTGGGNVPLIVVNDEESL